MKKNKEKENNILLKLGNDWGYIPFSIDNNQNNRSININKNSAKSECNNKILLQNHVMLWDIGLKKLNLKWILKWAEVYFSF